MNETVQDLKMVMVAIKKTQTEGILEMKASLTEYKRGKKDFQA